MLKKSRKESLAEKIADVLHTAPAAFDPEDDNIDDTRAKLTEDFSENLGDEEELLSTFRKQNVDLLSDVDKRYDGKRASRQSLLDSDEDFPDDEDNFVQENNESEGSEDEGSNSEMSNSTDSDDNDEQSLNADSDENIEDNDENFKHFNEEDVSSQLKKGLCVKNQMSLWENLLEMRIQLQKCLIPANKMPQRDAYSEIKRESANEFSDQVSVTKNSLTNLLDKLLLFQKITLSKYPETKKLNKDDKATKENDDEEIPSDTEDELSVDDEEEESEIPKKRRKLNDFEKVLNERHKLYENYRNSVIQKWNDKTRIAVTKNSGNSHSILNHIEHTLSDRARLIKRTQTKRSEYTILGKEASENNGKDSNAAEEHDTEIFDDDDFYHQLLRELIEVKSADLTDPIQLGRQWIQLQKLRSKMKRKIDTKATKGRKIRYTVHTKLVNFMAPIDEHLWTDQAKTELFNSLFGKKEYIRTT